MTITITSWNVQNFKRDDEIYADKLNYLAGILKALGSDVVALQEVLEVDALQDLAEELNFQAFAAPPDGRGNRVAFLTRNDPVAAPQAISSWRLPEGIDVRSVDSSGNLKVLPDMPRPAFQITIAHNGGEIDVITAHLKSKLLTFGEFFSTTDETLRANTAYFALERRAAEATSIREHVTDLLAAGRSVVVLGDMNDGSEAATTQMLYGPPGSQPRGPEDETRATGAFQRADQDDERRLFNVTSLVPEEFRWSRRHNGQKELLDHILASAGLMPRSDELRQVPKMHILNEDAPNLIGAHPTAGGVIPDHAAVTAVFV